MVMAWPVPAIAMLVLAKSNPAATRGVPRPKLSSAAAANSAQGARQHGGRHGWQHCGRHAWKHRGRQRKSSE